MALVKVAELGEIPPGGCKRVLVKRHPIAIFHLDDGFYAIDDTCTHAEASLCEGQLMGDQVACPLHGARFDIRTGKALTLPAVTPVETYQVVVQGNDILVEV